MGAKTAAVLQTVLTCIIGGAGILLIVASVINGNVDDLQGQMFMGETTGTMAKNVLKVAVITPFFFIGFDVIPQAAEEINVPLKKIGKMMILSVVLAVVFYSFVILAVGYVLNPEEIALSQSTTGLVTADAMAKAFGTSVMAKVIIVGGMCGIVTSWNSFMIGGSRCIVFYGRILHGSESICKTPSKAQNTGQCTDPDRYPYDDRSFRRTCHDGMDLRCR